MGRNLVILLDGTGNELSAPLSNVAKLYMACERDESQLVYYELGLGVAGYQSLWSLSSWSAQMSHLCRKVFELATGGGLRRKAVAAYKFLAENWREGDEVYLIGFSRGAFTCRVVAGMIREVGLLRREQLNLCEAAFNAYVRAAVEAWTGSGKSESKGMDHYTQDFRRRARTRCVPIKFVGLWDSVSSVLVWNPRCWLPVLSRLKTLPHTAENCIVHTWRHAIAIDERRAFFIADRVHASPEGYRPVPWENEEEEDPVSGAPGSATQDLKEVWFAGYHGDVGGGYPESESHLSKYPLLWLVREAQRAGLRCHEYYIDRYARGVAGDLRAARPTQFGPHDDVVEFVPPRTHPCHLHSSLHGGWLLVECMPQRVKRSRTSQSGLCCGLCSCYCHLGEARVRLKQRAYRRLGDKTIRGKITRPCCCCCSAGVARENDRDQDDWVLDFTLHYSALQKHRDPNDPYQIKDLPENPDVEGPETDLLDLPGPGHDAANANANAPPDRADINLVYSGSEEQDNSADPRDAPSLLAPPSAPSSQDNTTSV